jgi:hypothetical protein
LTTLLGQTGQIKVKKSITQEKINSVVTIGGLYEGRISVTELLASNKFIISNNIHKFNIVSYTVQTFERGLFVDRPYSGDTLSKKFKNTLLERPRAGTQLIFKNIKAVSEAHDTLFLNPIVLITK